MTDLEKAKQWHLVHEAYERLLARAAKYDDPSNPDYEWDDSEKWERHALNAALDLKVARDSNSELLERV